MLPNFNDSKLTQDVKNNIKNNLKTLRESKKYSQADLAEMVEVSQGTISGYERGERNPNLFVIIRISQFFEIPLNKFLGIR